MLRAEPEDGQRQPDLVVLVALVLEGRHRGAEDRRDGLLGRRLGDRAGDPDDERVDRVRHAEATAWRAASGSVDGAIVASVVVNH